MIVGISKDSRIVCTIRFDHESDYSLFWTRLSLTCLDGRRQIFRLPLPIGWPKVFWIDQKSDPPGKIYSLRERRRIVDTTFRAARLGWYNQRP